MPEYRQGRVCARGHDDGIGHSIRFASNYVCVRCSDYHNERLREQRRIEGAHAIARARDDMIRSLHYRDGVRLRDIHILLRVHRDTVRMALYSGNLDTMNARRIISPIVFGDLGAFSLEQHTESAEVRGHRLVLQTSDGQTDDGKRGTFYLLLTGPLGRFEAHIEWCPIADARDQAIVWAEKTLDAAKVSA